MSVAAALLLFQFVVGSVQTVTGTVFDASGGVIAGARVELGGAQTRTAGDGTFTLPLPALPASLTVSAPGFSDRVVALPAQVSLPLRIVLEPQGITTTLTVSASAGGSRVSTPAAVTVLGRTALDTSPSLALDEQLRSVPGFSLFRRSSSRVANPTTQGVTLRGLAASGASRAAVIADGVSLADPFGGWVYWDRVPAAAIERVEVVRGGASDIYGSDAMGGAIRIDTSSSGARAVAETGEDRTARLSGFAGWSSGGRGVRGGAERFTTDGFVIVAPESRGPIDVAAWSEHTSLFGAGSAPLGSRVRVEGRATYLNEDRGNGTPAQINDTSGGDVSAALSGPSFGGYWTARGVFTSQDYMQTFSAVNADRTAERLTSTQYVASSSGSASFEWVRAFAGWTLVAAASGRHVGADLLEELPAGVSQPVPLEARQRTAAASAQLTWPLSPRATLAAGARVERWSTRATGESGSTVGSFVPRAAFSFSATPSVSLRASYQEAFRVPTINELYRGFRVGNIETLSNPSLVPEGSRGADVSMLIARGRSVVRVTGYFARVRDAIVNETLTVVQSPTLFRVRTNAGAIHAHGIELEGEFRLGGGVSAVLSGAFASSTFGGGSELEGLRVPQVPRAQLLAGLRGTWARGSAAAEWRYTGEQFDDDRNRFLLAAASVTDVRGAWTPRRGIDLFVAVENLFDVEQDVGRTPVRTIGLPRTARVGVRVSR